METMPGSHRVIEQVFARLDANVSGGISVDEAEGPLEGHFDQIDTDGNGEITEYRASKHRELSASSVV